MGRAKEELIQNIVKDYVQNKLSQTCISKKYSIGKNTVKKILKERNVKIRDNSKQLDSEVKDKVVENYLVKKMSLIKSGEEYGLSQKVVETILKQYGVQKRSYLEAKNNTRKYTFDEDFFKHQTSDMAYILGFLAADGCVDKKGNGVHIQIHKKDELLLESIRDKVSGTFPIKNYTTNLGVETSKISMFSKKWKDDLEKYGITPQKTFTLKPPRFLKEEFFIDYIHGFFDGDGCILYNEKSYKRGVEIVGASKDLIFWIHNIMSSKCNIIAPLPLASRLNNGTVIYKYSARGVENVRKIYNLFYHINKTIFLKRKKDIFEKLLHETS